MIIETKLNIGDKCFFLMLDAVREAKIEEIEARVDFSETSIIYTIDENTAGSQYTKRLLDSEVFPTKQDLLNSL